MIILPRIYLGWNSKFPINSELQLERELDSKLGLLRVFSSKGPTSTYLSLTQFSHCRPEKSFQNTKPIILTPV